MKASQLLRAVRASTLRRPAQSLFTSSRRLTLSASAPVQASARSSLLVSSFSTTSHTSKGLQPDSSNPRPPNREPSHSNGESAGAAQIGDAEYHEIADQYLNTLVLAMEELAEKNTDGVEAEFSAGVLTITHPQHGTYVLNKQPPNRQIWLSSPISGPKRYDWVIPSSSQGHKEDSTVDSGDGGSAGGKWIYLRDQSSLSALLKKELGVEVTPKSEGDMKEGGEGLAKSGLKSPP